MSLVEYENGTATGNAIIPRVHHQPQNNAIAIAGEQQRQLAEVQASYTIARANPRDEAAALDKILTTCQRRGMAEIAIFSYSRGGQEITGPSVRLLEACAQKWGNLRWGWTELSRNRGAGTVANPGESLVRAYATDLESNVGEDKIFTVPHLRDKKGGPVPLKEERDIYERIGSDAQRRVRTCLEHVIPRDIVDTAMEECNKTLHATAEVTPERLKKLLEAFATFGVTQAQIEARLQRKFSAMQPAQLIAMGKIYTSLRDGMGKVEDFFTVATTVEAEPKSAMDAAKDKLRKAKESAKPAEPKHTSEESQDSGLDSGETVGADGEINQDIVIQWAEFDAAIKACTNKAALTSTLNSWLKVAVTEDDRSNMGFAAHEQEKAIEQSRNPKGRQGTLVNAGGEGVGQ